MKTAVQQIMLGTVTANEAQARKTLHTIKAAGYDGLELNRFMIHLASLMVRAMTRAAGMPTGKGGRLDWHALLKEADLSAMSLRWAISFSSAAARRSSITVIWYIVPGKSASAR